MDVNDLLSTGVVAAVIVLIFLSTVRRMLDLQKIPLFMWPVLLLAGAMPSFMAYTVLNPGEVFDKAEVRAQKDTFKLQIPADGEYALMVTALLGPEDEEKNTDNTAYTMRLELGGEEHRVTGTIRRDSGSNEVEVDVEAGNSSVREAGRRRSGGLGEDLQDRFDIVGNNGLLEGTVTNWKGEAAQVLFLEVAGLPARDPVVRRAVHQPARHPDRGELRRDRVRWKRGLAHHVRGLSEGWGDAARYLPRRGLSGPTRGHRGFAAGGLEWSARHQVCAVQASRRRSKKLT